LGQFIPDIGQRQIVEVQRVRSEDSDSRQVVRRESLLFFDNAHIQSPLSESELSVGKKKKSRTLKTAQGPKPGGARAGRGAGVLSEIAILRQQSEGQSLSLRHRKN
jgi:hypothetical protein